MLLEKRNTFSNDIIIVDGLWGTGKSLLAPVVSGMRSVEKVKIERVYENVSCLFELGKIDKDAAVWMLRTYADAAQYHNTIGREVNLRWSDDSGLKYAPNMPKLIRRLFDKEGDHKIDEINQKNLAFCVMTHMLMLSPILLPEAFGNRVKVIEMVRHPLYMVSHIESYLTRYESPREFTTSYYHDGVKVPWFVRDWNENFVKGNYLEQAVLYITHLYPWLNDNIESYQKEGFALLDLSFEEAVFETDQMLEKLQHFTGRCHHPRINKILKKQKLPREKIVKGRGHESYGWSSNNKSEEENYHDMLDRVKKDCSEPMQIELDQLIKWYNGKYPSKLAELV